MKRLFAVLLSFVFLLLSACAPLEKEPTKEVTGQEVVPLTQTAEEALSSVMEKDLFFALLSRYYSSYSLSLGDRNDFRKLAEALDKEQISFSKVIEYLGIPRYATEHTEGMTLHYLFKEWEGRIHVKRSESGDALLATKVTILEKEFAFPSEFASPVGSARRQDLLATLVEEYAPNAKNLYVGTCTLNYPKAMISDPSTVSFSQIVDKFGFPWHAWEAEGKVYLKYVFEHIPDFTFVFIRNGEDLMLEEVRTLYLYREDLTSDMVQQLKIGESTRKDVYELLGVAHGVSSGNGFFHVVYHLTDGSKGKISFENDIVSAIEFLPLPSSSVG